MPSTPGTSRLDAKSSPPLLALYVSLGSNGIALRYFPHHDKMEPWELGRRLGPVSLAVAVGLVLVWGLAAVLCRAGA